MHQWVIVYLCSHKVQVKLNTPEPTQKDTNVGKGLVGSRVVGIPGKRTTRERMRLGRMYYTHV